MALPVAVVTVEITGDVLADGGLKRRKARIIAGAPQALDPRLSEILILATDRLRHLDVFDVRRPTHRLEHGADHVAETLGLSGADVENTVDARCFQQPPQDGNRIIYVDEIAALITVGDIGHYARTAELDDDDDGTLLHVNHEYGAWSAIRLYRLNLDADNRKRMLPAVGLHISTSRLTEGYHNENYFARLDAWCGVPPFTWEIETGSLPPGMRLQSSKGMIFGRAEQSGEFHYVIKIETDLPMGGSATCQARGTIRSDTPTVAIRQAQSSDGQPKR